MVVAGTCCLFVGWIGSGRRDDSGLTDWLGLHWIIAVPLALFLGFFPLVGSIFGMIGAINVWQWEWWQAGLLFFVRSPSRSHSAVWRQ